VPTVWDDTRVLDAEVAEYLVIVRRSGKDWFLAALTANKDRDVAIKLDFLGRGRWKVRIWKDAADSQIYAEHLDVEDRPLTPSDALNIHLAPCGGCVARFQEDL